MPTRNLRPRKVHSTGILSFLGSQRGTVSLIEYSLIIIIVVGAASAIMVYMRRALQGQIRDAREYVISYANEACDENCKNTAHVGTRNSILSQYEPYYVQMSAAVAQDNITNKRLLGGTDAGKSGNFIGEIESRLETAVGSKQLPPRDVINSIQ
jgi:hypothetical protein